MQSNLRALFAGKREAAEVPAKRGPGRPPKKRERPADEQPDAALEALKSLPDQPEAYEERLRVRARKRKLEAGGELNHSMRVAGKHVKALSEASGEPISSMRIPGGTRERDSLQEGPQVRLRLCKWMHKRHEALGGTDEAWDLLVHALAEQWGCTRPAILRILKDEAKWQEQCEARGVGAQGLQRDQAQLPRYLRKSRRCTGEVKRAGGGRKDHLMFLYPIVKDFFESMRVYGIHCRGRA